MDRLVYGLFDDHDTAQRALDDLLEHGVPEDVLDLTMHEQEFVEGDFTGPATKSRRFGVIGGLATAVVGAILGGVFAGGVGAALGALSGGLLGTIVSSLAGADDAKKPLGDLVKEIREGKVLLTVDLTNHKVGLDCERFLEEHGASRVGMT